MDSKLYVGNLSYTVSEYQLRELFAQAGEIKEVTIVTDRQTGRTRGFAFVEFATKAEADKAIEMFNNHELEGRPLTVNLARPREERSSGGYRAEGGRGGYGGGRRRY